MLNTNNIVQAGDNVAEMPSPSAQTDLMLEEMKGLYLGRCKALQERNELAVDIFNRQIANLRVKLSRI